MRCDPTSGQGYEIGRLRGRGVIVGDGEARVQLSSHPTSAAAARRFVHEALDGWACEDRDAVLVCTDELVTNAIVHVCSDIDVVVRRQGDTIRVEVHDVSTRPPLRRVGALDAERGRGLQVVEALSSRWGVLPTPAGKAVWCELASAPTSSEVSAASAARPAAGHE